VRQLCVIAADRYPAYFTGRGGCRWRAAELLRLFNCFLTAGLLQRPQALAENKCNRNFFENSDCD